MASKRDYRAEYKRRIERALKLGYSRSVARGHPKKKTVHFVDKAGVKRKKLEPVEVGLKGAKFLGVRPGTDIAELINKDALYVFGKVPRRKKKDSDGPHYQLRLSELARTDGTFDWTNEGNFIEQMRAAGLTEREAYTFWFSP